MTANPLSTIPPIGPTTGMTPPPASGKLKPVDPVKLLRQHLVKLVIAGLIGMIVGGGVWYTLRTYRPAYTSEARLVVFGEFTAPNEAIVAGMNSYQISEVQVYIANQIERIRSDETLRDTVAWPTVQNGEWFPQFNNNVRRATEALKDEHLKVGTKRGSTLINLSVSMGRPEDAQRVLDALITVYLQSLRIDGENDLSRLSNVFIREKERAEDAINQLNAEIGRFIQANNLATLAVSRSEADIEYQMLSKQRVDLDLELSAAQSALAGFEQAQQEGGDRPMTESEEMYLRQLPSIAGREEQLRQFREQLRIEAEMGRGDSHGMVRQLRIRMASIEQELQAERQAELLRYRAAQLALARQRVEGLTATRDEINQRALAAHDKMKDLTQRLQAYDTLQANLDRTREQLTQTDQALTDIRKYQRRDEAVRVRRHTNPTEAVLTSPMPAAMMVPMVSVLFAAGLGLLLFVLELLDQRVKSPADVKLLPDATLLGVLPDADEDPSGSAKVERVVEQHPTGLMAESYRQVRTSVLSKMDRRGYKTLVLVAAQPGAGTSSVAQNLAASLAFNGRNVLLVDSNFRRPGQHTLANIPNDRGLVDILRDRATADEVIVKHPELPLAVLPTGQAAEAPPELLEGSAFRGLLGQLETDYDLVLIDAPPALLTSDSQLLAKHVDAIVVIVRSNADKRGMVERMLGRLDGQRADVLGIVLNGVKSAAGGYFRKSYEQFYRYRGADRPAGGSELDRARANREPAKATAATNGSNGANGKHDDDLLDDDRD